MPTTKRDAIERHEGFDELVHSDSRRLFGLALLILRDPTAAEDAVQESFLLAWKSWSSLKDPAKAPGWLTRICVNHCLRQKQRRSKFSLWPIEAVESVGALPPEEADPDLAAAFTKLSTQQRAVVALHYHYGYTLDEAAAIMRCAPGTARSHLARALTILRREVTP